MMENDSRVVWRTEIVCLDESSWSANFEGAIPPGVIIPNLDAIGPLKNIYKDTILRIFKQPEAGLPYVPKDREGK